MRFAGTVLVIAGLVCPVRAGLLDSAPPALDGGAAGKVAYRMGPVHYEPGSVDTEVSCTNLADTPAPIAVEIFDEHDALVGGVARATMPPRGTTSILTSAMRGLPAIEHGKARVTARDGHLTCTAEHHIRADDGSVKELPVELVKKTLFDQ